MAFTSCSKKLNNKGRRTRNISPLGSSSHLFPKRNFKTSVMKLLKAQNTWCRGRPDRTNTWCGGLPRNSKQERPWLHETAVRKHSGGEQIRHLHRETSKAVLLILLFWALSASQKVPVRRSCFQVISSHFLIRECSEEGGTSFPAN